MFAVHRRQTVRNVDSCVVVDERSVGAAEARRVREVIAAECNVRQIAVLNRVRVENREGIGAQSRLIQVVVLGEDVD
jgi:CO dehydrogenase nickel-insertion accessory protein CooC1